MNLLQGILRLIKEIIGGIHLLTHESSLYDTIGDCQNEGLYQVISIEAENQIGPRSNIVTDLRVGLSHVSTNHCPTKYLLHYFLYLELL